MGFSPLQDSNCWLRGRGLKAALRELPSVFIRVHPWFHQ
jgi:hypothetical protein